MEDIKELFKNYMADCAAENDAQQLKPDGESIRQYANDLASPKLDGYGIFGYQDEVALEPIAKSILAKDSRLQGIKWYSRFLAQNKFKKLLKWFVNQIRINNGITPGKTMNGNGYKGGKVREAYKQWRTYLNFEIDCSLRCDYAKAMSGANYIHLVNSRLNIIPIFVEENGKPNVQALQIILKHEKDTVAKFTMISVQELELFDENYPNKHVREFFETYSNLIEEFKTDQNAFYAKYAKDIKCMTKEQKIPQNGTAVEAKHDLNLILYGPPGTGKTYNTIIKAVEIIDGYVPQTTVNGESKCDYEKTLERYRELVAQDRIAFTTFHQAYGYEEFIEGIKPDLNSDELKYIRADGVFKEFCKTAREIKQTSHDGQALIKPSATVWKISLDSAGRKGLPFHNKCIDDSCIRVGWDSDEDLSNVTEDGKDIAKRFVDDMEIGDIVLSCWSQSEIDAIGIITGESEWREDEPRLKRFRKVKWLRTWRDKEKYNILNVNHGKSFSQQTVYRLQISVDDVIKILNDNPQEVNSDKIEYSFDKPYVFIIDEINRGNVSKIFGELITLIEPSKRLGAKEEMTCTLTYSGDKFGVPKNVYIIGTMNTADRSLVQLDAALRRRFNFEEMPPKPELLKVTSDGIDLNKLLTEINKRITALLDREHQIGHSYFIDLEENATAVDVQSIFKKNVIPLLQEYFFDNYETILLILGNEFVKEQPNMFDNGRVLYEIECPATASAYQAIYGGKNSVAAQDNE